MYKLGLLKQPPIDSPIPNPQSPYTEVNLIVSNKALKISLLIGLGVVLFIAAMSIASLDFARWLNCNSPFTSSVDKNSDVCRRLQSAP